MAKNIRMEEEDIDEILEEEGIVGNDAEVDDGFSEDEEQGNTVISKGISIFRRDISDLIINNGGISSFLDTYLHELNNSNFEGSPEELKERLKKISFEGLYDYSEEKGKSINNILIKKGVDKKVLLKDGEKRTEDKGKELVKFLLKGTEVSKETIEWLVVSDKKVMQTILDSEELVTDRSAIAQCIVSNDLYTNFSLKEVSDDLINKILKREGQMAQSASAELIASVIDRKKVSEEAWDLIDDVIASMVSNKVSQDIVMEIEEYVDFKKAEQYKPKPEVPRQTGQLTFF